MQTIQRTALVTEKQIAFITKLTHQLDGDNAPEALLILHQEVFPTMTRTNASAHIDRLLKATHRTPEKTSHPDLVEASPDTPEVPAGRYALTDNGETAFYKVDRPKGIWDGWTFITAIDAHGDNERPVKGPERRELINRIAQDPTAASVAYGRRTGTCGMCSRTLTVQASIDAGIGPVCASRF